MNIKNASFINSKTLNILFLFFPAAFLMGNAVLNINILLISITGIIVFRKKIFSLVQNFILLMQQQIHH